MILVSIANHCDHVTRHCWPSIATIASEAGCSTRTVDRYLPVLAANGFLVVNQRRGKGGHRIERVPDPDGPCARAEVDRQPEPHQNDSESSCEPDHSGSFRGATPVSFGRPDTGVVVAGRLTAARLLEPKAMVSTDQAIRYGMPSDRAWALIEASSPP